MEKVVVETVDLTKRFGSQCAVESLNLNVESGSVYGLLGPNGAGKTTLLKLLTGLLRPSTGEVRLFGEPWRRHHLSNVGALIETVALYSHLTGPENLEVHTRLLNLPKRRIGEVLEQVNLADVGRKKVSAYSLGMRQRLGIAVALLDDPLLLILDEPTNGLDPRGIREMRSLIRSFRERGITVIVSSHMLAEIEQVVSHVGVISEGRLRYQGTLDDLMARGRGRLELRTAQSETALQLLGSRFPGAHREDGTVSVPVSEEQTAELVAYLSRQNIRISSVNYRHDDLESLFMQMTDRSYAKERAEVDS